MTLRLRIILQSPPAGVDIGVQDGKGSQYRTVQVQRTTGQDLVFECDLPVRSAGPEGVRCSGPMVQGPADGQFIYLDIGKLAGQFGSPWDRRMKVPLAGIDGDLLAAAGDGFLEARFPGTARDGGPSCATVRPLSGWQVASRG